MKISHALTAACLAALLPAAGRPSHAGPVSYEATFAIDAAASSLFPRVTMGGLSDTQIASLSGYFAATLTWENGQLLSLQAEPSGPITLVFPRTINGELILPDVTAFRVPGASITVSGAKVDVSTGLLTAAGDGAGGGTFDPGGSTFSFSQGEVRAIVGGFPLSTYVFGPSDTGEIRQGSSGSIVATDLQTGLHDLDLTLPVDFSVRFNPGPGFLPIDLDVTGSVKAFARVPSEVFAAPAAVPEPSSLAILLPGLVAAATLVRGYRASGPGGGPRTL